MYLRTTRDDKEFMLSAWAARMFENQRVLLDIAQKRQLTRDAGHLATSPAAKPTTFPIGTYVMVTQATGILGGQAPYQTASSPDGALCDSE